MFQGLGQTWQGEEEQEEKKKYFTTLASNFYISLLA